MEKKFVKEAYSEALKLAEKEKREKVKEVILETLKELEKFKKERNILNRKIEILKRDLNDFKQGRLDLIEERQKKDPLAREVSVFKVERLENKEGNPKSLTYSFSYSTSGFSWNTNDFHLSGTDFCHYTAGTYDVNQNIFYL